MSIARKIIFLDFDGPLSNLRTSMGDGYHLRFDATAIQALNNICEAAAAKIVCTSVRTWGQSRESFHENRRLFEEAGLDIRHLHAEWSCRIDHQRRETHITRWLERHPEVTHYAIVDDEGVDLPHFVKVSMDDGILFKHFEAVAKCLDFDIGLAFNTARMNNFPEEGQYRLPLEIFDRQFNESVARSTLS